MPESSFAEQVRSYSEYGYHAVKITDSLFRLTEFDSVYCDHLERDITNKPKAWKTLHAKVLDELDSLQKGL